jgi:glycosyltransferase involved in cell wall biosynthesis
MTSYYPPDFGGYGILLAMMMPRLIERGIEPTVLAYSGRGSTSSARREDPPYVHRLLSHGSTRLDDLRRIFEVRSFLRARAPSFDLIHSTVMGWEQFLTMPLLRRLGIPLVLEMVLFGSDDAVTLRREFLGRLKLRSLRDVAAWIGVSEIFRAPHEAVGLPPERFHLLHNPVDTDQFHPCSDEERTALRRRLGIDPRARVVLTIGAVQARKGIDRLLRAWEALRPVAGRDLLRIVGPATAAQGLLPVEARFADEMRRIAEGPALKGTVHFTGRSDRIQEEFAAADLFLFLSRKEGFGTVTIEAMATGLPVVVSPLDGIGREIVTEGVTGHVTPDPDDAAAVAAIVSGLLDDDPRRRRLGDAARRDAIKRFSWQLRVDRLLAIYDRVLNGGSAGASTPGARRAG